jgi:spore coat protein U-like protein
MSFQFRTIKSKISRHMLYGMLLGLAFLINAPAFAALTCSVSSPSLDFGTISTVPIPQTDVSPSLTVTCSGGTSGQVVRTCVGINAGTGTGSTIANRIMNSGANTIQYEIYFDAARSVIWGDSTSASQQELDLTMGASGSGSQVFPLYGRLPNPPAQFKPVGSYASSLTLSGKNPSGGSPCINNTGTAITGGAFISQVSITSSCTISASNINFGNSSTLASAINSSGSLSLLCSLGLPYSIAMNSGSTTGNTISARRMSLNGAGPGVVSYQLYRDVGPSNLWGDGTTGVVYSGTGIGATQSIPVLAQVPAQVLAPPGTYMDTVRATITY